MTAARLLRRLLRISTPPDFTAAAVMTGHGLHCKKVSDVGCYRCGTVLIEAVTWVDNWEFYEDGLARVGGVVHICPTGRYDTIDPRVKELMWVKNHPVSPEWLAEVREDAA